MNRAVKIGLAAAVIPVLLATLVWLFCPKPDLNDYQTWSSAWFDRHGKLLRLGLASDERYRLYQSLDKISPRLIDATILYEDQHYYQHSGVDFNAIFRAFWQTYVARNRRIGASTIAMQVARLRWNIDSSSASGKFLQILRALQLSRHFSKNEILEAYFNLAPYGRNIEGVGAASLIYFNKPAAELSLPEVLTLSVIPQNPNKRNPATEQGYRELLTARKSLFERWVKRYPEDKEKSAIVEMPLEVRELEQLPFYAPHFVTWLERKRKPWDSGEFYSSLDLQKQNLLQASLAAYVEEGRHIGINNGAMLLLNYESMEIEAMIGSADFFNSKIQGQVNGTLAKRSPGSTLKPFVYGLAFDEGLIHPNSLMRDSPMRFAGFTPENFDKKFLGPLLASDALALSRNLPAVDLQAALTQESLYNFLQAAGISGLKEESHYGLALTLGGAELSMLELVTLYAVLANHGLLREVKSLLSRAEKKSKSNRAKQRKNASVVENISEPIIDRPLLSPEASFMVLDILRGVSPPAEFDRPRHKNINDMSWKTGTSWAFRDAWAVGISGSYVLAVWIGNFNGEGNNAFVGRKAAGPLLFSAMEKVVPAQSWKLEELYKTASLNVRQVDMCGATGDLPGRHCPRLTKGWFIPGVSPIKVSNIYRQIPLNKKTGLRSCNMNMANNEMRVFEFWPSDFLDIFRQAGISLRLPPAYDPSCSLDQRNEAGLAPIINSPQPTLDYLIASENESSANDGSDRTEIPFSALADGDAKTLYWFVGNEFIGQVSNGATLYWAARQGVHEVKVVDDSGRTSTTKIVVNILP